jgi:hypothetical protein
MAYDEDLADRIRETMLREQGLSECKMFGGLAFMLEGHMCYTIYVFPDCASCASVSEAAPGHPGYNGGRWRVVEAHGITSQLTNAEDVVAAASALVDTGTRFVCPLIKA